MSKSADNLFIRDILHWVTLGTTAPPMVLVPGSSGRASDCFALFRPWAEEYEVPLLVPEFGGGRHPGYQRLRSYGHPLGAARALDRAVDALAEVLGRPFPSFDLVGFSGGAQFAHRYALLYPQRVRRLVVGAAGWYTQLDPDRPFPYGIAPSIASGDLSVDVERFLGVDILVTVGERDIARDAQFRSNSRLDAEQGEHRLSRALNWYQHLLATAEQRGIKAEARFEVMSKTNHSFSKAMANGEFGLRTMRFVIGGTASRIGHLPLLETTTLRTC